MWLLLLIVFDSKMQRTLKEVKLFVFSWENIVPRSFQFGCARYEKMCKLDKCERKKKVIRRTAKKRARLYLIYSDIETHLLPHTHTPRPHTPCIQFHHFWYATYGIETCLTANVFAKKPLIHTTMCECVCVRACVFRSTFITKRKLNVISILLWQIHQFGSPCKMFWLKARALTNGSTYTLHTFQCMEGWRRARSQRVCTAQYAF